MVMAMMVLTTIAQECVFTLATGQAHHPVSAHPYVQPLTFAQGVGDDGDDDENDDDDGDCHSYIEPLTFAQGGGDDDMRGLMMRMMTMMTIAIHTYTTFDLCSETLSQGGGDDNMRGVCLIR